MIKLPKDSKSFNCIWLKVKINLAYFLFLVIYRSCSSGQEVGDFPLAHTYAPCVRALTICKKNIAQLPPFEATLSTHLINTYRRGGLNPIAVKLSFILLTTS